MTRSEGAHAQTDLVCPGSPDDGKVHCPPLQARPELLEVQRNRAIVVLVGILHSMSAEK